MMNAIRVVTFSIWMMCGEALMKNAMVTVAHLEIYRSNHGW